MKLIGLTGGIATGKSTVSRLLSEQNIPIIDADKIARDVVEPGKRANTLIRKHFGDQVFLPDGHLDRPKLGQIIFQDAEKRKILNSCTHPYIRLEMVKQALWHYIKGADIVIFDVPLLFESKLDRFVGKTVVVYCSEVLQLERLRKRDNLTEEQAVQRISSQMAISEKVKKADILLDNSSDIQQLEIQVKNTIRKIRPSSLTWLFEYLGLPIAVIVSALAAKLYIPAVLRFISNAF